MSFRGDGAWDGGPPGAEADYASTRKPTMPSTDPWTGASYAQYPANYDYRAYSANYAAYGYDQNYYQSQEYYRNNPGSYSGSGTEYRYNKSSQPSQAYEKPEKRQDYKHSSRTPSPPIYSKTRYSKSRDRDNSYDRERDTARSRERSRKYSSSRSSSLSSRDRKPKGNKHRSYSTDSSNSTSSSMKSKSSFRRSLSSEKQFRQTPEKVPRRRRSPHTPDGSPEKERLRGKEKKSHSNKDKRVFEEELSKKKKINKHKSMSPRKSDKSQSLTPPRAYKCKEKLETPPRKYGHRDSSITPPKSYMARRTSRSSSRESHSPRKAHSRSRESSHSHTPPRRSRSASRSRKRKTVKRSTKRRSSSRSESRERSVSPKGKKKKRKPSNSSRSSRCSSRGKRSRSRSPADNSDYSGSDERRGQFTVADRKRFWKLHKSRQDEKSPPKEPKPPPGAVETVALDDIQYGDPPEVEGPNFAELPLSSTDYARASSSKARVPLPIRNDGSFLEMFKKMQEVTQKLEEPKSEIKKPALPFIGKRRGGRVLKTGLVKKAKAIDEQPAENPKDAWSLYMQEVKKYRETSCEEERKTRPLVK